MKTFENFIIDDKEKFFLELSHFNELELKFDLIGYRLEIFHFYNKQYLFCYHKPMDTFYINEDMIWLIFQMKFGLDHKEMSEFFEIIVHKYFNLEFFRLEQFSDFEENYIQTHFNI